jgi:hypothetical protein
LCKEFGIYLVLINGVELGKQLANSILDELIRKNKQSRFSFFLDYYVRINRIKKLKEELKLYFF